MTQEQKDRRAKNILKIINRFIALLERLGIVAELVLDKKEPGTKKDKSKKPA